MGNSSFKGATKPLELIVSKMGSFLKALATATSAGKTHACTPFADQTDWVETFDKKGISPQKT